MTNDEWRSGVNARLKAIEDEMVVLKTKGAVDEVHRANVENRLTKIERQLIESENTTKDNFKWLFRLIVGSLIGAVLAFAYSGGLSL